MYFFLTVIRYELLETDSNSDLIRALYGLLSLMPQTKAFLTLNDRLKTLPQDKKTSSSSSSPKKSKKKGVGNKMPKDIDFASLLAHFSSVQVLHDQLVLEEISQDVVSEEAAQKLFEMQLSESENVEFSVVDEDKLPWSFVRLCDF